MRILVLLSFIFCSLSAGALTRPELDALLKERNLSVSGLELQGLKIVMGEVTGHLTAVPFKRVAMLITRDEAILPSEFETIEGGRTLGELVSARFRGQYILLKDVRATVLSP